MSFEFEATNSSNAWFGYNFPNEGRDFQNFMWLYRGPQFDKKKKYNPYWWYIYHPAGGRPGNCFKWLILFLIHPIKHPRPCSSARLRPLSHMMSQEPWPCNGEDPWLSSKARSTMGVGKAVLCSQGPSNIVWSEKWTMLRDHCIFVGRKKVMVC